MHDWVWPCSSSLAITKKWNDLGQGWFLCLEMRLCMLRVNEEWRLGQMFNTRFKVCGWQNQSPQAYMFYIYIYIYIYIYNITYICRYQCIYVYPGDVTYCIYIYIYIYVYIQYIYIYIYIYTGQSQHIYIIHAIWCVYINILYMKCI